METVLADGSVFNCSEREFYCPNCKNWRDIQSSQGDLVCMTCDWVIASFRDRSVTLLPGDGAAALERIRTKFVEKLASQQPDHPWLSEGPFAQYAVAPESSAVGADNKCLECGAAIVEYKDGHFRCAKKHLHEENKRDAQDITPIPILPPLERPQEMPFTLAVPLTEAEHRYLMDKHRGSGLGLGNWAKKTLLEHGCGGR